MIRELLHRIWNFLKPPVRLPDPPTRQDEKLEFISQRRRNWNPTKKHAGLRYSGNSHQRRIAHRWEMRRP